LQSPTFLIFVKLDSTERLAFQRSQPSRPLVCQIVDELLLFARQDDVDLAG
jgi:hypothetical protein